MHYIEYCPGFKNNIITPSMAPEDYFQSVQWCLYQFEFGKFTFLLENVCSISHYMDKIIGPHLSIFEFRSSQKHSMP